MTLGEGLVELFFIDTNPAVQKYYDRPWANFTGMVTPVIPENLARQRSWAFRKCAVLEDLSL